MSRWFRFYSEALRNPKVMRLSDKEFRLWVRLLAVAAENDGRLPPLDDLRHILSIRLDHLSSGVDRLMKGGLIDALEAGYEPHNWGKFQYKSDTSTPRVTKFRGKRNVSETAPDTETEAEVPLAKANGAAPDADKVFWDSAKAYLGPAKASHIGKWVKTYGKPATARAITEAQLERAVDPPAYVERCLRNAGAKADDRITV